jgi:hypothetical protein
MPPPGNAEPQLGASHIVQSDSDSDFDFDFVLFASAVIDDDAIMGLITRFSAQRPG